MGKKEIEDKIPDQKMHEMDKAAHMHELRDIFNKLGIKFCLGYGMVLSSVRNGKFIPSDGDIDFIVMEEDAEGKREEIVKALEDSGHFNFRDFGYNRIWCNREVNGYMSEFDLYIYPKHEAWRVEEFRGKYALFPKELFERPKMIVFYGKTYFVPNPPEEYLRLCYGSDWRIPHTQPRGTVPDVTHWDFLPTVEEYVKAMESVEDV